ncbi:Sulfite exporter TauE/SafE, partial [Shimia gijangensis]
RQSLPASVACLPFLVLRFLTLTVDPFRWGGSPADLPLLLVGAVFAASMLQAVTGIGFGVIAGPVLIVTMANAGAIQASILLSLLIALLLSPSTIPRVNRRLLAPLFLGVCIGTPIGALAFLTLTISSLKLCAAVIVGFMTLVAAGVLSRFPIFENDTRIRRVGIGVVSGILNAALAMPGPAVAAYATAIKSDKSTIQATTLVTFLLAYPVAFAFQAVFVGISNEALEISMKLVLPTLSGTVLGASVARFVPERLFKSVTVLFLIMSVLLLVSA